MIWASVKTKAQAEAQPLSIAKIEFRNIWTFVLAFKTADLSFGWTEAQGEAQPLPIAKIVFFAAFVFFIAWAEAQTEAQPIFIANRN